MNGTTIETYPWKEVFAWAPVTTINKKRVWLKKVWKRKVLIAWGAGFHYEPAVQYATSFDILQDPFDVEYVPNIEPWKLPPLTKR